MTEPLIQSNTPDHAKAFQDMAERIRANAQHSFGGAIVIIPPANGGDTLEMLILDVQQDPATFWTLAKTKCDLQIGKVDEMKRNQNPFGRR